MSSSRLRGLPIAKKSGRARFGPGTQKTRERNKNKAGGPSADIDRVTANRTKENLIKWPEAEDGKMRNKTRPSLGVRPSGTGDRGRVAGTHDPVD